MNWGIIASGFGLGTFKFMFAQWMVYGVNYPVDFQMITEIFISVLAGAWVTMAACYFFSGYLMKRAKQKRQRAHALALEKGIDLKKKKNFTRINKLIVWIKRTIGIYGITLLAPLFLSIPIGGIVCAKFYGTKKITFPLMMLFTGLYSFTMALIMYASL